MKRKKRLYKKQTVKGPLVPKKVHHSSSILQPLSSLNISKMLSHFMAFRSTIRDLSSTLQRMEKMLDSTYQMFEIAQTMMKKNQSIRQPLLPDPKRNDSVQPEEDLPVINLPDENEAPIDSPFAHVFRQVDPRFLFQILQSPFVQRMISQFFVEPRKTASRAKLSARRKQG